MADEQAMDIDNITDTNNDTEEPKLLDKGSKADEKVVDASNDETKDSKLVDQGAKVEEKGAEVLTNEPEEPKLMDQGSKADEKVVDTSNDETKDSKVVDQGLKVEEKDDIITNETEETKLSRKDSSSKMEVDNDSTMQNETEESKTIDKDAKIESENADLTKKEPKLIKQDRYTFEKKETIQRNGHLYSLLQNNEPMMYKTFLDTMCAEKEFRDFLTQLFKEVPFKSYVWETCPVNQQTYNRMPFKFAILNSPSLLGRRPQPSTFGEYFSTCKDARVTSFTNLYGDANLVSPLPFKPATESSVLDYSHIGSFMENATNEEIDEFWVKTSSTMTSCLNKEPKTPLWLSTAGHGVAWLHARIDTFPKYYSYTPFKKFYDPSKEKEPAFDDDVDEEISREAKKPKLQKQVASRKRDWDVIEEYTHHGANMVYSFAYKSETLGYMDALTRLQNDPTFRSIMHDTFKECQHRCFIWETIPVSVATAVKTPFEMAMIKTDIDDEAPTSPIPQPLLDYFGSIKDKQIVTIKESDVTVKIGPNPVNKKYKHMGQFMDHAPDEVVDEFLQEVGKSTKEVVSNSRAGIPICLTWRPGNSWFHANIDFDVKRNVHEQYNGTKESWKVVSFFKSLFSKT